MNKAKGERGKSLAANIPHGYRAAPADKKKWLIDGKAAEVVRRVFSLCMEGRGPSQIARVLTEAKILNPAAYKRREGRNTPQKKPENPCRWEQSTIKSILERREYTACTVNFKPYTNSIWDRKKRDNPLDKLTKTQKKIWMYMKFRPDVTSYRAIARGAGVTKHTAAKWYETMRGMLGRAT